MLVVWQDDPKLLLERAQALQNALTRSLVGHDFDNEHDGSFAIEETSENETRHANIWQAAYTGISMLLLTAAIGFGWRQVAIEQVLEPNWLRLLLLICIPAQMWLSLVSPDYDIKSHCANKNSFSFKL